MQCSSHFAQTLAALRSLVSAFRRTWRASHLLLWGDGGQVIGGDNMMQRHASHYHVLVVEDDREPSRWVETFESWDEAETHAGAISRGAEDWLATRYPGRPWICGEVAVYQDRRVLERSVLRREVSVVRCPDAGCLDAPPGRSAP